MTLPPIHREILVDAPPDVAFALFTSKIGDWWPLAELSVFGAGATVAFEDGALVERSPDGQAAEWGQVTSWLPPGEFSMTWHPGRDTLAASQVTVTFRAAGDQTLVVLEHAGWDVFADPAAARAEYEHGWPEVLRLYQAAVAPARREPGAAPAKPLRKHQPRRQHQLLRDHEPRGSRAGASFRRGRRGPGRRWRRRRGDLGGAGAPGRAGRVARRQPLRPAAVPRSRRLPAADGQPGLPGRGRPAAQEPGAGMAILRLPGAGRLAEATRLATEEDASVVTGFFTVTVRPWQVMLTGSALAG